MGLFTIILIAIATIMGAVLTAFVVVFWRKIAKWLREKVEQIKENLNLQGVIHGSKMFLKKVGRKFRKVAEHFSKMYGSARWLKQTTISEELIEQKDVPEDILSKCQAETSDTVDITVETKKELELANSH